MPDTPGQDHFASAHTAHGSQSDSGKWFGDEYEGEEDPLVGTVLSNTYEVLRILGEGGMGRVYEAQHTRIASKKFAIKALHPEYARKKEVLVRFQREVEAAASIHSPHVVGVFDVDQTEDGQPFLVSELLEGIELGEYLDEKGAIPIGFAVNIVRQICKALNEAHDKGIIHRDMKPENVFLCGDVRDPVAKVLDFGISRLEGPDGNTLTKTGIIMGTPSYMAPEQAKGTRVDHRVDVYAVGAILYQAATGKVPFDRADATATLAAVLTEEPERPRAINPSIPEAFEMVIQRAMASEPEDRYANMAELEAAIAPFDERELMLSMPDKSSRLSAVRGPQSSMLDTSDSAREAADARPQLILFSALAAAIALFALIVGIGGGVRSFSDGDFSTLGGLEALVIGAILVAALATPAVLIFRNIFRSTWDNTARVLEALKLVRDPVLAALTAAGLTAITVRLIETFILRTSVGVAWPMWDVLIAVAAIATGGSVWWMRRSRAQLPVGTAALVSAGGFVLMACVAGGVAVRTPPGDVSVQEDDSERSRKRSKSSPGAAPKEAPKPAKRKPLPADLPKFDSAMKAWQSVIAGVKVGHWKKAVDGLEVFVHMDPKGPEDRNVRKVTSDLAVKACVNRTADLCLRMMRIVSEDMGESGIDILFELTVTRGGTGATWHAAKLLADPDVVERGSKALQVAHALRTANNCDKVRALLGRATADGDYRATRELKIIAHDKRTCRARGCCMLNDEVVKATITAIKSKQ